MDKKVITSEEENPLISIHMEDGRPKKIGLRSELLMLEKSLIEELLLKTLKKM
jgi:hypothetical protein